MYFEGQKNQVYVEVSFQHNDSFNESVFSFVNNINTPEGGTHLQGFRNSLTKTFNDYARNAKLLKDSEPNLSGEDTKAVFLLVRSLAFLAASLALCARMDFSQMVFATEGFSSRK